MHYVFLSLEKGTSSTNDRERKLTKRQLTRIGNFSMHGYEDMGLKWISLTSNS